MAWLVLLTAFYYLSDMICILFLCPFQLFLMGNRCCVNCRIFAWGSWMMVTLLVLIPSPVTAVPLLLGLSLLIRWGTALPQPSRAVLVRLQPQAALCQLYRAALPP